MTDPQHGSDPQNAPQAAQNDPGSAIAIPSDKEAAPDSAGVGDLPQDARARIAIQRAQFRERLAVAQEERNFMAAATKITWAKDISPDGLIRLAGWARSKDLDLLTEFNILGGSAGYVNARWYIRQLGYLVAENLVEYAYYDTVTADPKLQAEADDAEKQAVELETRRTALSKDAQASTALQAELDRILEEVLELRQRARDKRREIRRRADERRAFDLPDHAKSAIVWHIKLTNMAQEVRAAQAVGGYRGKSKKDTSKDADPIGEDFPRETSITRGCRKVMLSLGHVAHRLKEKIDAAERAAEEVAVQIGTLRDEERSTIRNDHVIPAVKQVTPDNYAGSSSRPSGSSH
jgi:hypothetical protein